VIKKIYQNILNDIPHDIPQKFTMALHKNSSTWHYTKIHQHDITQKFISMTLYKKNHQYDITQNKIINMTLHKKIINMTLYKISST
jgi:hypothetical protein